MFPGFLEDVCEVSLHIYADWNQDCDFDDEDELIAWHRTNKESGADIAIPFHAKEGKVTIRFILHNGRIRNACQSYIDGEVEDYSIDVFSRSLQSSKLNTKKIETKLSTIQISPNPVMNNGFLLIENSQSFIKDFNVNIISLDGILMKKYSFNEKLSRINTSQFTSGIYIVETKTGAQTDRTKIMIQN